MEETRIPIKYQQGKTQEVQVKIKSHSLTKRNVKTWTPQEDKRLCEIYNEYPKKWNKISELMGHRNQNQCLHRFRRLSQLGHHKKIWSRQEDQTVLQMVAKYGNNWKLIASVLKTKTGKQIRQRYINKLDPQIKKQEWTQKQDIKLIQLYTKYGSKWSQISKELPGRPQNKIKNRFYSFIQKNYDISIKDDSGHQNINAQSTSLNSPAPQECQKASNIIACFDISANSDMLFIQCNKQKSNKSASYSQRSSNSVGSQSSSKSNKYKMQMDQQGRRPGLDFNKQNRQLQKCQKLQRILSKKSIDEEWNKQRSLQQINQPNQLAYPHQNDHDFFYFQDN